jgi:hypothetical protein
MSKDNPQVAYSVRLSRELDDLMENVCSRRRGTTKKQIIEAALKEYFYPEGSDKKELEFSRFLDRLERRTKANERYLEILGETLSFYIRVWLTQTMELPEDQQEAARRVGGKRYRKFVELLGQRLQAGKSLFEELPNDVLFRPEAFFSDEGVKKEKIEGETL